MDNFDSIRRELQDAASHARLAALPPDNPEATRQAYIDRLAHAHETPPAPQVSSSHNRNEDGDDPREAYIRRETRDGVACLADPHPHQHAIPVGTTTNDSSNTDPRQAYIASLQDAWKDAPSGDEDDETLLLQQDSERVHVNDEARVVHFHDTGRDVQSHDRVGIPMGRALRICREQYKLVLQGGAV